MRKAIIIVMGMLVTLIACVHELPHDYCATDPVQLTATSTDAIGTQNNGTITATATGGSGFQYSLNGGAFIDTGYFSGLAGNADYQVVAKNSRGCTDTVDVTVGITAPPNPCAGVTITVSLTKVDATLNQSNGSITATASPGTGYTYSLNGGAFQASGTFSGLAAGNYTVTAKNADGCTGASTITVGSVDPCAGVTITIATTQTNPSTGQSNGSITATASPGTGFIYSLNGGAYQASGTFTGLAAGVYTVSAKNSNGCVGVKTVNLNATNPCTGVTITVTATKTDPTTGQNNGSITASATGGTGFTYSLNGGAFQASGTFSNLGAGTYTVTAKSSAGCTGSTTVTLVATNPCNSVNITISNAVVNVLPCATPANNGSITVTASGSTGFTYNINGGAYQAGNVFSNLATGTYTIGVKDANGCTKTASAAVATKPAGTQFSAVRTLIRSRCSGSGCHVNGSSAAGYNFDNDCSIVSYWSQIRNSCVNSNSMPKPPQPTLTTAEKQTITTWINGGHTFGN